MADRLEPALGLRFAVEIDGLRIDRVMAVDGLAAEWEVEEYREGGNRDFVHRLPVRLLYKNVRLTRPVDSQSGAIAAWFTKARTTFKRSDARVLAYDGNKKQVAEWELTGAWPIKYTGPSFTSTGTPAAATEILEIAHNGFTTSAG